MTQDLANSHESRANAELCEDFDILFLLYQHKDSSQLSLQLLCDGGFTSHNSSTLAEPRQAAVLP